MTDTGQGNAAYYADILQAILTLAATAPGGPPASTADFLQRLNDGWLLGAWTTATTPPRQPASAPPPGTSPTSPCACPPCSPG